MKDLPITLVAFILLRYSLIIVPAFVFLYSFLNAAALFFLTLIIVFFQEVQYVLSNSTLY